MPRDGSTVLSTNEPARTGTARESSAATEPVRAASNTHSLLTVNVIVAPKGCTTKKVITAGAPRPCSSATSDSSAAPPASEVATLLTRVDIMAQRSISRTYRTRCDAIVTRVNGASNRRIASAPIWVS